MATIKRNGGSLITSAGKLSCSCCGSNECCMYSAQAFVDGIYGYDDLPDQFTASYEDANYDVNPPRLCIRGTYVKANGQIIPLNEELRPWVNNEYYYLGPISEIPTSEGPVLYQTYAAIFPETEEDPAVWAAYAWIISGPDPPPLGYQTGFGGRECLFPDFLGPYPEEYCAPIDEFASAYTIDGGPLGSIEVTRASLCLWTGLDSCGNVATLTFEEEGLFYGWNVSVPEYLVGGSCNPINQRTGHKEGFQNTPVGSYGNGLSVS